MDPSHRNIQMTSTSGFNEGQNGFRRPSLPNGRPILAQGYEMEPAIGAGVGLERGLMTSPLQMRSDSIANSTNGVISPANSHAWDQHFGSNAGGLAGMASVDVSPTGTTMPPFPTLTYGQSISSRAAQHPLQQTWGFDQANGESTQEAINADFPHRASFDMASFSPRRADSVQSFNHMLHGAAQDVSELHTNFGSSSQLHTPMSPSSQQDWMTMAQQEVEFRPMSKRMRASSPPVTTVDFARRDGIRKKNGRIDIPSERNIHTIDDMIEKTTDEDLLRELKQQKRLLRNREAALASRQRKKKHTEDLEIKEKGYTQQIALLEKDVTELSIESRRRDEERQVLVHRLQESQRLVESLQEQVRELNFRHSEETSTLRKRINILSEQIEIGTATNMSAAPSSAGFADFSAEMEALNMGAHEWENFISINEMNGNLDDIAFSESISTSLNTNPTDRGKGQLLVQGPVAMPPKKNHEYATDQPIASGLLFMLLLCGAFVASNPSNSISSETLNVPADVRAAAPAVLNSLLSDTTNPSATSGPNPNQYDELLPAPSENAFKTNGRLEAMHRQLTTPNKQQEIDEAFALTASQYAAISGMDYPPQQDQSEQAPLRRRQTLAEALAATRHSRQQTSKAEVYTRSLLWDQIPTQVVKQFKEMVRDHQTIDSQHDTQPYQGNAFKPKNET